MCRPAFALLDAVYRWVSSFSLEESEKTQKLPPDVKDELRAISALAVFFEANLELPWHSTVYMTDASDQGFGAVATKSNVDEIRREQVWQISVDRVHSDIEEEVRTEGLEEDEVMYPKEGRPGILDLSHGLLDLKGGLGHLVSAWIELVHLEELVDVSVVERILSRLKRR